MASSQIAKSLSFFLILTVLSALHVAHARDSQFFNKVPGGTVKNVDPIAEGPLSGRPEQEPSFDPENDNVYGLYGQELATTDAQPSSTVPLDADSKRPLSKYLPKNYNPVAYVTEPEQTPDSTSFPEEQSYSNNNNYDSYVNSRQDKEPAFTSYPASTNENPNNYYSHPQEFTGGVTGTSLRENFNSNENPNNYYSDPQEFTSGATGTSSNENPNNYYSDPQEFTGGVTGTSLRENFNSGTSFKAQGMSDTRSLENGKFFYDVGYGQYSSNHPYASLRSVGARNEYNNRNYYTNNGNAYDQFNGGAYKNQYEIEDEGLTNLP